MFPRRLILLLTLFCSLLAGAQPIGSKIVFTPQATAQAQFAGYYVALEQGFYADEGLDVVIVHPYATQSCVESIWGGFCIATTLPLPMAMKTVDNGLPLVNILQTSMNSGLTIVSRNGEDPLTLGKARVASFRAGFGLMARCLATDYEWITTASMVNLFTAGAVDATLAMSFDEYYKLLQTGLVSPGRGIYRFEEGEYNIQEDGVYVTRAFYEAHREACEGFARASRRGWEWVSEHREEALDLVMRYVKEHRIATNRTLQGLMLDEVLRLQQDRESGVREFRLRRDMVEKANDTMLRAGILIGPVTYEELMP
jgi:NitT/TauT family transport system substrate-binding protein